MGKWGFDFAMSRRPNHLQVLIQEEFRKTNRGIQECTMRKAYSENGTGDFEEPREAGVCWMEGVGWVVFVWCLLAPL